MLLLSFLTTILKRSRDCLLYTKKETDCGLFTVTVLMKIMSEPKVSKSLYIFIMSSIPLVRHCCCYGNMVCKAELYESKG